MNKLYFVITIIYFIDLNNGASPPKSEKKFTLTGRVTFPGGSSTPIEPDGKLTVELQDTSLADAPAKVIARGTSKVTRFPVVFGMKYSSSQIIDGHTYSLNADIRNKKNELLYTNDVQIRVTPLTVDRKKLIEVPVILVKKTTPASKKLQWPELVGKNGQDAVRIIKKETGNILIFIKEGSPVTLDYRTNRVRVFVNKQGIVATVPTVG
ncbi:unnamed protein product [Rotaria sp. Silwood2]|nr:unnamed protein product [Rotaria sp. Silwood2]CAF3239786.1 unnamed protein product [Rotaria sp. Silwood2]CAF4027587.1 unnamed protein product [Rotaria sp. Silwood2]